MVREIFPPICQFKAAIFPNCVYLQQLVFALFDIFFGHQNGRRTPCHHRDDKEEEN